MKRYLAMAVLAVLGVLVWASAAPAANPHVESAFATMASPTVLGPANITWNTTLVVSFKVSGLGKTPTTVSMNGRADLLVYQAGVGVDNVASIEHRLVNSTPNLGVTIDVIQDAGGGGTNTANILVQGGWIASLTTDKTGQVKGTLTIPSQIDASTDGNQCVQASWSSITLTVGSITFNVPGVSEQYESTASFCEQVPPH